MYAQIAGNKHFPISWPIQFFLFLKSALSFVFNVIHYNWKFKFDMLIAGKQRIFYQFQV